VLSIINFFIYYKIVAAHKNKLIYNDKEKKLNLWVNVTKNIISEYKEIINQKNTFE